MIAKTAQAHLEKEYRKLTINLERAKTRKGVTPAELEALQTKIDVNKFLQKCVEEVMS